MMLVPENLGQRIIELARMAAALHLEGEMELERQPAIGSAAGGVKDDVPFLATQRKGCLTQSPWTLAGEHPAGSFAD